MCQLTKYQAWEAANKDSAERMSQTDLQGVDSYKITHFLTYLLIPLKFVIGLF